MERLNLSSMTVVSLVAEEMLNVRGGEGSTTTPPPVRTGIEKDIIL